MSRLPRKTQVEPLDRAARLTRRQMERLRKALEAEIARQDAEATQRNRRCK